MQEMSRHAVNGLNHLYLILDAGERGYAVAAANVNNRAVKMLFNRNARQRADFKSQLAKQLGYLGPHLHSLIGTMAMIHRGRINIFAALTIGEQDRERVVLKEVLVGEREALRAYERVLKADVPTPVRELVEKEFKAVQEAVHQMQLLQGSDRHQIAVRLYDTEADASRALKALQQAGFDPKAVERVPVEREPEAYERGGRSTLSETILSGATGGAMWGAVSGVLAGFGVLQLPGLGLQSAPLPIQEFVWAQVALGAIVAGAFVGAVLGIFIGWGIHGGDAYVYNDSRHRGQVLLMLHTEPEKAAMASEIMAQVNREARAQAGHVPA